MKKNASNREMAPPEENAGCMMCYEEKVRSGMEEWKATQASQYPIHEMKVFNGHYLCAVHLAEAKQSPGTVRVSSKVRPFCFIGYCVWCAIAVKCTVPHPRAHTYYNRIMIRIPDFLTRAYGKIPHPAARSYAMIQAHSPPKRLDSSSSSRCLILCTVSDIITSCSNFFERRTRAALYRVRVAIGLQTYSNSFGFMDATTAFLQYFRDSVKKFWNWVRPANWFASSMTMHQS